MSQQKNTLLLTETLPNEPSRLFQIYVLNVDLLKVGTDFLSFPCTYGWHDMGVDLAIAISKSVPVALVAATTRNSQIFVNLNFLRSTIFKFQFPWSVCQPR